MGVLLMIKRRIVDFVKFTAVGFSLLSIMLLARAVPYKIANNVSDSEAEGFYFLNLTKGSNYKVGDLVAICIPDPDIAEVAIQRNYLTSGACPYKTAFEIKHITATYPSIISREGNLIRINNSKVNILERDSLGRPLKSKVASMLIPKGYYFVMGKTPNSLDSRYYGLVPESFIAGFARSILTWK
jgi:conjugative transfer signal peptidase TraF